MGFNFKCQINDCSKCSALEQNDALDRCLIDKYRPGEAHCVCKAGKSEDHCFKPSVISVATHDDTYILTCEDKCQERDYILSYFSRL